MGCPHHIHGFILQYYPQVKRIKVVKPDGGIYWTNSPKIVRQDLTGPKNQLKLNI